MAAHLSDPRPAAPLEPRARRPRREDAAALAELMLAAYSGTIDDAGEGPDDAAAEVERLLSGGYGRFDADNSEVIVCKRGLASATLVTHPAAGPLIAFSMTAPAWKRRGLARAGLLRVMERLGAAGFDRVELVVTVGNRPAEALYAGLGFRVVEGRGD